jgi:hypothetical protein
VVETAAVGGGFFRVEVVGDDLRLRVSDGSAVLTVSRAVPGRDEPFGFTAGLGSGGLFLALSGDGAGDVATVGRGAYNAPAAAVLRIGGGGASIYGGALAHPSQFDAAGAATAAANVMAVYGKQIPTISSAVYWGDFSDESKVTRANGKISGLANNLGGALQFAQETEGLQPTYQLASEGNGINGLNTCRFAEFSQFLDLSIDVITDATIVIVVRNTANLASGSILNSSNNNFAGLFHTDYGHQHSNNPGGISDNFVDGVDVVNTREATKSALGTSAVLFMVRNIDLTTWGNASSISEIRLGRFWATSSTYSFPGGDMGEIVVMSAASVAEQNALGAYLSEKWGTATWTDVT